MEHIDFEAQLCSEIATLKGGPTNQQKQQQQNKLTYTTKQTVKNRLAGEAYSSDIYRSG